METLLSNTNSATKFTTDVITLLITGKHVQENQTRLSTPLTPPPPPPSATKENVEKEERCHKQIMLDVR